jgi:hypothetical protein
MGNHPASEIRRNEVQDGEYDMQEEAECAEYIKCAREYNLCGENPWKVAKADRGDTVNE